MVQNYELYLILNPLLEASKIADEIKNIESLITKELSAINLKIDEEGLRRMAYPIRKQWNGFYALATFDLNLIDAAKLKILEKKLNLIDSLFRYLIINQTEYLTQKGKEKLRDTEINNHRELNKGKKKKVSLPDFQGLRAIDYKDVEYISQFVSPYSKIFAKARTGTSAKFQRKIANAVKRARHMALMSFTARHLEG